MTLADVIAGAALAVSLWSLYISYRTAELDSVKLRAWCTFHPTDEHNEHPYITVVIVNEGRRTAILRILGGDLPDGCSGRYLKGEGGLKLGENERFEKHMGYADLTQNNPDEGSFANLWFEDSLGKRHPVKDSEAAIREYHAS